MERWRHIACWPDWIVFWRGQDTPGKSYKLTAERSRRIRELLGDAITPAKPGQSWMWSWNDWDWDAIAKGGSDE